ncbi:unnamed protein product, partial [Polarella glacialis]
SGTSDSGSHQSSLCLQRHHRRKAFLLGGACSPSPGRQETGGGCYRLAGRRDAVVIQRSPTRRQEDTARQWSRGATVPPCHALPRPRTSPGAHCALHGGDSKANA